MRWLRSLRMRVIASAIVWGIGFATFSHIVAFITGSHHVIRVVRITHFTALWISAAAVLIVGLLQLRWTLAPFSRLRTRLAAVRDGRERRVSGPYPPEFDPLLNDLNGLLDHRERLVDQALKKAADMAHGLKTPLALLNQEADTADAAGLHDVADQIRLQVAQMRKQIDYHLAQARATVSGATPGLQCEVHVCAEGLVRTLRRLCAGRELDIAVNVPASHVVKGRAEDVDEMLGNLLDNACKWAKSKVRLESQASDGYVVITVDDDGPGLAASMREAVLKRGVRADETEAGSGLGLAIVRDLADSYGGRISLTASEQGGLRAILTLPSAVAD